MVIRRDVAEGAALRSPCVGVENRYSSAHETHVAAKEAQARSHTRLFEARCLRYWSSHAPAPSPQGPRSPLRLGMKASHRLSTADFKTMRIVRRVHGRFFSLAVAPHPHGPKWACVVSKKVSAKAVVRNRLKRRARAILAPLLKHADSRYAFVFHARRTAAGASFAEIRQDIEQLCAHIA